MKAEEKKLEEALVELRDVLVAKLIAKHFSQFLAVLQTGGLDNRSIYVQLMLAVIHTIRGFAMQQYNEDCGRDRYDTSMRDNMNIETVPSEQIIALYEQTYTEAYNIYKAHENPAANPVPVA